VEFLLSIVSGAIRSAQVIEFVSHMLRHVPASCLSFGTHARPSQPCYVGRAGLWVEFLHAYPPELKPVQYLWSHWKQHELPNFCVQNFGQLNHSSRKTLRRMRQRPLL